MHKEGVRGVGLAVVLACCGASSAARAERGGLPRVELQYVVRGSTPGCPSAAEFRAGVARELTFDAFGEEPTAVITVTIEDAGRGSRATIELAEGGSFVQHLAAARSECAALAAASEQAVVLAIERLRDDARPEVEPPAPEPPPTLAPPAEPPPPRSATRATSATAATPARTLHVDTYASGAVSRGFVPAVAGGTFVGASVSRRWWMASLDLGVWWPTHVTTPDEGPGGPHGATVRALWATTALCVTKLSLVACGTAGVLDLRATGVDVLLARAPETRFGTFGARAGWLVPLHLPWSVELYVGLAVPTTRVLIRAGDAPLWKSPAAAGEAGMRFRVRVF